MCRTLLIEFVSALCLQALYRGYRVRKVFYKLRKEVCPGAAAGTMARHPLPRFRGIALRFPSAGPVVEQFYSTGGGDVRLRRRFFADELAGVTAKLQSAMRRHDDEIDKLFAEVDR